MSLSKRVLSAFLVAAMCITVLYTGNQVKEEEEKNIFDQTATLHLWYTDEALTDYLGSMAVKYSEEYGIRVIPVLQSGLELLEKINEASLQLVFRFRGDLDEAGVWAEPLLPTPGLEIWRCGSLG